MIIALNLLTALSPELQKKLKDFVVYSVTVECGEVNTFSEYDIHPSYIASIEEELLSNKTITGEA